MDLVSQTMQRCVTEIESSSLLQRGKERLTMAIGASLGLMVIMIVLMLVMIRQLLQIGQLRLV